MKPIEFSCFFSLCILLLTACGQAPEQQTDMDQVKSEIQAIENAWAEALNNRDVDALMAMYADDAVILPNNGPMQSGKDAIRKELEREFAMMPAGLNYTFQTADIFGNADLVTEIGTSTMKDAGGNVTGTGKYTCVFEKQDGKYLVVREIYNNDKGDAPSASRSIHLFDLPASISEGEWLAALKEMNGVIEGLGYPGAGYYLYKTENADSKDYRYYFEGIWPSAEAYTKIHNDPAYIAVSEKHMPLYNKIKEVEIYRKVMRVQ